MENASSIDLQYFFPEGIRIEQIEQKETGIDIWLQSIKRGYTCPRCGKALSECHGTYNRIVQDLPMIGKQVLLHIRAREYECREESCQKHTIAEDYEGFIGHCKRMTYRLEDFIRTLALETNCEGAAAICQKMGIEVSGDTIIRVLMKLADQPVTVSGESIGVDDFAYKKGQTYCTVICDGETHAPLEILDGRDGGVLREWLKKNKQVKVVTRDRAGAYASAISQELPNAMQIADRFHLHQNLLKAVKEALKKEVPNRIPIPLNDTGIEQISNIPEAPLPNIAPAPASPVASEKKRGGRVIRSGEAQV